MHRSLLSAGDCDLQRYRQVIAIDNISLEYLVLLFATSQSRGILALIDKRLGLYVNVYTH